MKDDDAMGRLGSESILLCKFITSLLFSLFFFLFPLHLHQRKEFTRREQSAAGGISNFLVLILCSSFQFFVFLVGDE